MEPIRDKAQGHWLHVLTQLGVPESSLTRPNRKCPLCPNSRDSFSFNHELGTFYCRKCQGGSGTDLVMRFLELDFMTAKREIERVLGVPEKAAPFKPAADPAKALNRVWLGSKPVRKGDQAHAYLQARGLSVLPESLRLHPGLRVEGKVYPAMLGMIVDVKGKGVSIHRTFLHGNQKAPVEAPKRYMPPKAPLKGCAIRLWPATDTVGLAEGIETSIACHILFDLPVWACLDAIRLEEVQLPESIRNVVIFADEDSTTEFAGQVAAFSAARRLAREKRNVKVKLPPLPGSDFLAELLIRQGCRAA